MSEFVQSGLSQADLARRLGKRPEVVCRWLAGPGNWTLDTVSDLLFAVSGAAPVYGVEHPLMMAPRNQKGPTWLYDEIKVGRVVDTDTTVDYSMARKPQVEPVS